MKFKSRRNVIPYNPALKKRARQLRNKSSKTEIMLWQFLKNKQLLGYDPAYRQAGFTVRNLLMNLL
jgi:very-short-patch-repair endonuclease